jgi:hypothetical protein
VKKLYHYYTPIKKYCQHFLKNWQVHDISKEKKVFCDKGNGEGGLLRPKPKRFLLQLSFSNDIIIYR